MVSALASSSVYTTFALTLRPPERNSTIWRNFVSKYPSFSELLMLPTDAPDGAMDTPGRPPVSNLLPHPLKALMADRMGLNAEVDLLLMMASPPSASNPGTPPTVNGMPPFNRTKQELKHAYLRFYDMRRVAFNRTKQELKPNTDTILSKVAILLIAPSRN